MNKVVEYRYDSWGSPTAILDGKVNNLSNDSSHIANINPFRYRSYYYDSETNLYYLNSRYYNPTWGRFLNSDTISTTTLQLNNTYNKNLYAYTDNNPVNRIDTQGESWWAFAAGVFGAIVGGVSRITSNIMEGKSIDDGLLGSIVGGFFTGALLTTTWNPALAYYGGAYMESFTNESVSYISGKKEFKKDNLRQSQAIILKDTAINGMIGMATGGITSKLKITNSNWFQPQKFVTSFTGNYTKKKIIENYLSSPIQYGITKLISPINVYAPTYKSSSPYTCPLR